MVQSVTELNALDENGDSFETPYFVVEGFIALVGFVKSDQFSATPSGVIIAEVVVTQSMDTEETDIVQTFPITDADEVKTLSVPIHAKFLKVEVKNLAAVVAELRSQLQLRRN
jgi:hypothetical protein